MAITDNKVLSWNVTWRQWLGIAILLTACFIVIYFGALIAGYVVATLALSAFFVVVAFDFGVSGRRLEEPESPAAETRPRDSAAA